MTDILDPAQLEVIAKGLAAAVAVAPPSGGGIERRWWRLLASDSYDAWLIEWPPDRAVEPHDHGGSHGAFAVAAGELAELTFEAGGITTTSLAAGASSQVHAHVVHDVVNQAADTALSVHVYAPPLSSMLFYDAAGVPCRAERVDPERPLWSVEPFAASAGRIAPSGSNASARTFVRREGAGSRGRSRDECHPERIAAGSAPE